MQLKPSVIGEKKIHVSRLFKISRNTLDLWLKKERETGDYQASSTAGVGTQPKIRELEKFSMFVKEQSLKDFKTVRECVDAAFKNCQARMRVAL